MVVRLSLLSAGIMHAASKCLASFGGRRMSYFPPFAPQLREKGKQGDETGHHNPVPSLHSLFEATAL